MANKNLNRKSNRSDEFYTTEESAGYLFQGIDLNDFNGKVVYCNCDGPESEIYKWLKKRYRELELKYLFGTKFVRNGRGVKMAFDGNREVITQLDGDGDCFSEECQGLIDKCDIVVTNPPFSRLGDFVPMVFKHNKDFAIIANMMCLGDKSIVDYTTSGKINGGIPKVKRASKCGNTLSFITQNGDVAYVLCTMITTLHMLPSRYILPSLTTAELTKKKRLHYEDTSKEMVVDYVRNIPVDLQGTCLAPITVCLIPEVKQNYEILGLSKCCIANGKARFHRVRIKKKLDEFGG